MDKTPTYMKKSQGFFRRTIEALQNHFFLRNIVFAVCVIIVGVYLTGLLLKVYTRHGQKYEVPNFIGTIAPEARPLASEAKLRLEVIDSIYVPKQRPGMIIDQSPKPGMNVKSGRRVFLTINASRPKMEVIPYVTGYSLRQAKNTLESKGFEIDKLVYKTDMATNNVLGESWNGKEIIKGSETKAELGSGITLTVGRNPDSPLPLVPKVIGLGFREAKSRLWEIGLNIGEIKYDRNINAENIDDARVYRQTPSQQMRADYGGRVALWLSADNSKISTSSRDADADASREPVLPGEGNQPGEDLPSDEEIARELGLE